MLELSGFDPNLNFLAFDFKNPENLSEMPPSFPTLASLSSSELSLIFAAVPSLSLFIIFFFLRGEECMCFSGKNNLFRSIKGIVQNCFRIEGVIIWVGTFWFVESEFRLEEAVEI